MASPESPPPGTEPPASHDDWHPRANPWLIAAAVMMATFMEILDTSIVNVALPHIAGNLSATTDEATWVLTSYLISNAIVLPASAWFGRLVGRKRFLMACIGIFTAASALCGTARSLGFLVIARVLQGAGGGALQPISQAVLLESFPPGRHGIAMAVYGLGVVLAPIIGPTLGGWLTDSYSWRWTFYINLPIGVLALLMTQAFIEDPPYLQSDERPRIDYLGFGLLAVGLGALQIVLDKGQQADWFDASWICWTAALSAAAIIAFVVWELRVEHPIVDLRVLSNGNFATGTLMMTALGVVLYSTTVTLPLFLQTLLNYPALQSGLALSPRGFGSVAAMLIVGPILTWVDPRLIIGVGFALLGVSCARFGGFTLDISIGDVIGPTIINGLGMGMVFVPLATVSMATLSKKAMGNATGIFNLMRNIGGSVGIATVTTLIARGAQQHQALLVGHLNPYDPHMRQWMTGGETMLAGRGALHPQTQALGAIYGTLVQQSALLAFVDNFHLLALICFAFIPVALILRRVRATGLVGIH